MCEHCVCFIHVFQLLCSSIHVPAKLKVRCSHLCMAYNSEHNLLELWNFENILYWNTAPKNKKKLGSKCFGKLHIIFIFRKEENLFGIKHSRRINIFWYKRVRHTILCSQEILKLITNCLITLCNSSKL